MEFTIFNLIPNYVYIHIYWLFKNWQDFLALCRYENVRVISEISHLSTASSVASLIKDATQSLSLFLRGFFSCFFFHVSKSVVGQERWLHPCNVVGWDCFPLFPFSTFHLSLAPLFLSLSLSFSLSLFLPFFLFLYFSSGSSTRE